MVGMISWALFVSGRDAGDTRWLWCWPKAINSARAP
ncbi:mCG64318, isoform CRA_a [Mus musculus]|nr:mCG64318, isoform CRA_a [Mus musculus]EDL12299.1 mCG64318, isoform CRA_a [Mus musculus]